MPTFLLQEKCYEVPREECRDITEQIPVKVCTQIDRTREPKATLVSRPYGRWVTWTQVIFTFIYSFLG